MPEKLVRDKIPEIIESATGIMPNFRIATPSQMRAFMRGKLREEMTELGYAIEDEPVESMFEELADVAQVLIDGGINAHLNSQTAEAKRLEKLEERGGFTIGVIVEFL